MPEPHSHEAPSRDESDQVTADFNPDLNVAIFYHGDREYIEKNKIVSYGYEDALRLINDPEFQAQETQKIRDKISTFNAKLDISGPNPKVDNLLSDEPPTKERQNVLYHEAEHMVMLPERLRSQVSLAVAPFGELSRRAKTMREMDEIPLYIAQIGGAIIGYEDTDLSPQEGVIAACAPKIPSHVDMQTADAYLGRIQDGDPSKAQLAKLIEMKKEMVATWK